VLPLDVSLRERVTASQSEIAREKGWDQELGMRLVKARVETKEAEMARTTVRESVAPSALELARLLARH